MSQDELAKYFADGGSAFIPLMQNGFDDYLAARWLLLNQRPQRAGSLIHRAVECFLKGAIVLIERRYDEKQLKAYGKTGHGLPQIWRDVKRRLGSKDSRFDERVEQLQKWEELRYPKLGRHQTLLFGRIAVPKVRDVSPHVSQSDTYRLSLDEVDELVAAIFSLLRPLNARFFFVGVTDDMFDVYRCHNNHLLFDDPKRPTHAAAFEA